ncbi:MAG TPA: GIY-YIG nuclease family protein [Cellvibrio sp.]|nr:GIY-YIG nuclease family protein [Cellvibrio sp.]
MAAGETNVGDGTWYVYMILTDKGQLYTGVATDVERRLLEHQDVAQGRANARGAKFFHTQKPLHVAYMEEFADRAQASRREHLIKSMSSAQKRKLVGAPVILPAPQGP